MEFFLFNGYLFVIIGGFLKNGVDWICINVNYKF